MLDVEGEQRDIRSNSPTRTTSSRAGRAPAIVTDRATDVPKDESGEGKGSGPISRQYPSLHRTGWRVLDVLKGRNSQVPA